MSARSVAPPGTASVAMAFMPDATCVTIGELALLPTWVSAQGDLFGHTIEADVDADGSGLPDLLVSTSTAVLLFLDP